MHRFSLRPSPSSIAAAAASCCCRPASVPPAALPAAWQPHSPCQAPAHRSAQRHARRRAAVDLEAKSGQASGGSSSGGGGGGGSHESSSFNNNLRKGFAPTRKQPLRQRSPQQQPAKKVVLDDDGSLEGWREIDKKVNKYPGVRQFTAIGTGGGEFRASMIQAVEEVVGPLADDCVIEKPSSGGAYLSVKISVIVKSPEEVVKIFGNIKKDSRLKWCM